MAQGDWPDLSGLIAKLSARAKRKGTAVMTPEEEEKARERGIARGLKLGLAELGDPAKGGD